MLFNTPLFIFVFLPVVFFGYFFLQRLFKQSTIAKCYLIVASLFFYAYWRIEYLAIIVLSIIFNYAFGTIIIRYRKKSLLILAITLNLALLSLFKYTDFIITNINLFFNSELNLLNLTLPLAISFFTFQQIAFLVDTYQGKVHNINIIDYMLFISFFPQLIAGPIVSHHEIMPQFAQHNSPRGGQSHNIMKGIFIFSLGLFKKVVIADTFAFWANKGFGESGLDFFVAWQTALSYTFQLYFDFSGYSDMAIGLALLFNIQLPTNFNSPYKALNIQDFWRRWHITLSRFLLTYIYIPLGGNRQGQLRTYTNLLITFILGGIWHGAGWTFIIWGLLHGTALVIHRIWRGWNLNMPNVMAWLITFTFINIAWVFFRAQTMSDALALLQGMMGLNGFGSLRQKVSSLLSFFVLDPSSSFTISAVSIYLVLAFSITLKTPSSQEQLSTFNPTYKTLYLALSSFLLANFSLLSANRVSDFLYFNF